MPGSSVATALYTQATPVPIAMSVNMFKLRVTRDFAPRTKKGHPAHKTTGVPRRNCSQFDVCCPNTM